MMNCAKRQVAGVNSSSSVPQVWDSASHLCCCDDSMGGAVPRRSTCAGGARESDEDWTPTAAVTAHAPTLTSPAPATCG